jgi:hypothetical protein
VVLQALDEIGCFLLALLQADKRLDLFPGGMTVASITAS